MCLSTAVGELPFPAIRNNGQASRDTAQPSVPTPDLNDEENIVTMEMECVWEGGTITKDFLLLKLKGGIYSSRKQVIFKRLPTKWYQLVFG